jgi:hypothetical protein
VPREPTGHPTAPTGSVTPWNLLPPWSSTRLPPSSRATGRRRRPRSSRGWSRTAYDLSRSARFPPARRPCLGARHWSARAGSGWGEAQLGLGRLPRGVRRAGLVPVAYGPDTGVPGRRPLAGRRAERRVRIARGHDGRPRADGQHRRLRPHRAGLDQPVATSLAHHRPVHPPRSVAPTRPAARRAVRTAGSRPQPPGGRARAGRPGAVHAVVSAPGATTLTRRPGCHVPRNVPAPERGRSASGPRDASAPTPERHPAAGTAQRADDPGRWVRTDIRGPRRGRVAPVSSSRRCTR